MSCCYDLLIVCGIADEQSEEKKEDIIMEDLRMNYELKTIKLKKKIKKIDQSTQTDESCLKKIKIKKKIQKEPGT